MSMVFIIPAKNFPMQCLCSLQPIRPFLILPLITDECEVFFLLCHIFLYRFLFYCSLDPSKNPFGREIRPLGAAY